jgi:tRNA(Ile)-lysidine synthase
LKPLPPLVAEHLARCRFPPSGAPASCAVSGGADSLALLVLATAAGCEVTAIHVDHGLREGSAEEADVVATVAERVGAAFEPIRVTVDPGPNLEARARAARYRALPPGVLTGHTADDQAETVVLNLLRGAGLDGLTGMGRGPALSGVAPRRPLLGLRHHDTVAICAALRLTPVDDPSNTDPAIRRNRVRHEVLPLLSDVAERDVVPIISRQAALLSADADLLEALAEKVDPIDARALAEAPEPVARRAVRRWLRSGDEHHPPDAATVERVLAVARGDVRATDAGGGRRVVRSAGRLRLE